MAKMAVSIHCEKIEMNIPLSFLLRIVETIVVDLRCYLASSRLKCCDFQDGQFFVPENYNSPRDLDLLIYIMKTYNHGDNDLGMRITVYVFSQKHQSLTAMF